jgi:hypothetical protein
MVSAFPGQPSVGLLCKTDEMGKYSVMHFKGSSGTFPGRTNAMLNPGFFTSPRGLGDPI